MIFTVILRYVYRQFQINSWNRITFTGIPFQVILKQLILRHIINADFKFTYKKCIFCVLMFMPDVYLVSLELTK
jgi:hypothetical protein